MDERRRQRLQGVIREAVGEILSRDVSDERLRSLRVTRVKLSRDGSNATLFFETTGTEEENEDTFEALESAKRFIRKKLASRVTMRTVPILSFVRDDSGKKGDSVLNIIRELGID